MNKNIKYWLALNKIEKLGPVGIKRLYEHFGAIDKIWSAGEQELRGVAGLRHDALKSLLENRGTLNLDEEVNRLKGCQVFCLEDQEYPANLKTIYDPPPVLYLKGELASLSPKALAIVGTRRASWYGQQQAAKFAAQLASAGFTIVSGLALGIDTAAHKGALKAQGKTVAVLGSAVDEVFPSSNRRLAQAIERSGALVSEFPLGTKPEVGFFPRRNRIIAGLSLGVMVIEGAADSGALITANFALEQGREVFALPGPVESAGSRGPHQLIKQGAKLIESVEDVFEELKFQLPGNKAPINSHSKTPMAERDYSSLSSEEQKIVSVLSLEPKHLDLIAQETKLAIPQVSSALLMLEVKQLVRQLPGKLFVLY